MIMTQHLTPTGALRRLKRLWHDSHGLAALEFALVSPFLVIVWLGMVELNSLLDARAKLQAATVSFGDLVSQEETRTDGSYTAVTSTVVNTLYNAVGAILNPLPNDKSVLSVRLESVVTLSGQTPKVAWSWSCGSATTFTDLDPAAYKDYAESDASILVVRVGYLHTQPITGYFTQSQELMTEEYIVRPRYSRRLELDDGKSANLDELKKSSYSKVVKTCPAS